MLRCAPLSTLCVLLALTASCSNGEKQGDTSPATATPSVSVPATPTSQTPTTTPTPLPTPTEVTITDPQGTPLPSDTQSENSGAACSDGLDNDDNGFIDCADYSCFLTNEGASDSAQTYCFNLAEGTKEECQDNEDNDGDGFIDCEDWSCTKADFGATMGALVACGIEATQTPTPECVGGDGYCPAGCDTDVDSDCGAVWSCGMDYPFTVDYLEGVEDLTNNSLESALRPLIDHDGQSYDAARNLMYGVTDDIDIGDDGRIECIYTGYTAAPDGTRNPGDITTEHSWPKSDGGDGYPREGDIHHLFPSRDDANGARGSYEFGETDCEGGGCSWSSGGSKLGYSNDGRGKVFDVRSAYRGDVARAHFYFSVRYNYRIPAQEETVLKSWHCSDPPDAIEKRRNDKIGASQGNRNPFVDRPDFVLQIDDF